MTKTNHDLTEYQLEALVFIARFIEQHRYAPSVREILSGTSYQSISAVKATLDKLEREGWIGRAPNVARGLWMVRGSWS